MLPFHAHCQSGDTDEKYFEVLSLKSESSTKKKHLGQKVQYPHDSEILTSRPHPLLAPWPEGGQRWNRTDSIIFAFVVDNKGTIFQAENY